MAAEYKKMSPHIVKMLDKCLEKMAREKELHPEKAALYTEDF